MRAIHAGAISVIRDGAHSGTVNMQRDLDLLLAAEKGIAGCRVYSWEVPCVSVGRFQSIDRGLIDPNAISWVRRPSGGKAVLHGWDVTVGLAVPLAELPVSTPRHLEPIYRSTVRPIVAALRACGVDAILAADSPYRGSGVHSGDCFAYASPNDVVEATTGAKLCGCALRLTQTAVLVQASIPAANPEIDPESVIVGAKATPVAPWESSSFADALEAALAQGWSHP